MRAFCLTERKKRGFPSPHGSSMRPLALDPGAFLRRGCDDHSTYRKKSWLDFPLLGN